MQAVDDADCEPIGMVMKDKWPCRTMDMEVLMCSDVWRSADGAYFVLQWTKLYFLFVRTAKQDLNKPFVSEDGFLNVNLRPIFVINQSLDIRVRLLWHNEHCKKRHV